MEESSMIVRIFASFDDRCITLVFPKFFKVSVLSCRVIKFYDALMVTSAVLSPKNGWNLLVSSTPGSSVEFKHTRTGREARSAVEMIACIGQDSFARVSLDELGISPQILQADYKSDGNVELIIGFHGILCCFKLWIGDCSSWAPVRAPVLEQRLSP